MRRSGNFVGIRKLSVFGSVLLEDFDPKRSDVDVLAEFKPGVLRGMGFRYFGYEDELSKSSIAKSIFARV